MDRVTNISLRTLSGATLGGFAYEYDALGRITSRSHTLGDPSQPSSSMSQSSQKCYIYDRVRSRSARARAVEGVGFASHGWRLAAMLDKAA